YLQIYNASMQNDAIPDATPIHGGAAVSDDHLLDRLIDFFNRLPAVVRGEASVLIVGLSGMNSLTSTRHSILNTSRGPFEASPGLGSLGNPINAAAVVRKSDC